MLAPVTVIPPTVHSSSATVRTRAWSEPGALCLHVVAVNTENRFQMAQFELSGPPLSLNATLPFEANADRIVEVRHSRCSF